MLGVADWASHKGLTSGTLLVDPERHRPVALLSDRSSARPAAWLRAHPGVAVIARDRAGADAEGARDDAPDATQVADRWHLVANLADARDAGQRRRSPACPARRGIPGEATPPPAGAVAGPHGGRRGGGRGAPAGPLRAGARTPQQGGIGGGDRPDDRLYKYLREGPPQRKRHTVHGRQRVLEPWKPSLLQRWDEGCHTATVPWREIRAQGFAHSVTDVHRVFAQLRREGPPPAGRARR